MGLSPTFRRGEFTRGEAGGGGVRAVFSDMRFEWVGGCRGLELFEALEDVLERDPRKVVGFDEGIREGLETGSLELEDIYDARTMLLLNVYYLVI